MRLCGFILAAGLGTRLRPLFPELPKPLVPVGRRPAIAWSMDLLLRAGVSRIIVNVHHQRERMREVLPGLVPAGVELVISEEERLLGTGGGIAKAREFYQDFDWLLIANADILTSLSLGPFLRRAIREDSLAHLILSSDGPESERGRIGRKRDGSLWLSAPGGEGRSTGVKPGIFLGLHIVRPEVFAGVDPGEAPSVIDIYRRRLGEGARVRASFTRSFWVDLGTEDGYRRAVQSLEDRKGQVRRGEG
ncbi:MAG: nucleotidyltransferase family protein [Leptospirillia bacterium]